MGEKCINDQSQCLGRSVCKGPEVEKELSILKELKEELWS